MDKVAHFIGEKMGDMVEDAVKNALGVGDKDEDEDKRKGGFFSMFGGDDKKEKEEEKDKGGLFSFGNDKKKEEEKGGFFSDFFDKDDDKRKEKKSGFKGLFSEQEGASATGGNEGDAAGGGENRGQSVGVNDRDLFNDLMDVAEETSEGR